MRAARAHSTEGPAGISVDDVPLPDAGPREAVVQVEAAGLSHADLLRSRGTYQERAPIPFVVGGELAGRVVSAPAGSGFVAGDRVVAIVGTGAAAEYAAVPVDRLMPIPDGLTSADAAASALNLLTARFALVERGRLSPGEDVVVLGAGGGVGVAAVQVARRSGAGSVTAVASTERRRQAALGVGADRAMTLDALLAEGRTADLLVDPVGGQFAVRALSVLREFGRHVVVGFAGGQVTEVKLNRAVFRNLAHIGAGWGTFADAEPASAARAWNPLARDLAAGRLQTVVGAIGELHDVATLLTRLEQRTLAGKPVVVLKEDNEICDDVRLDNKSR